MIRAALLALAAALPAAAAAEDSDWYACAPLSRHFELCPEGTAWVLTEWEQFGDGATGHLGVLDLDFAEDWAARDDAATPEVEAALSALLTDDPQRVVLRPHLTDRIDTAEATVARTIQIESFDGDPAQLRAWMVAATPDHRIMLILTAPEDFPLDEMERRSSEIARIIRIGEDAS